MDFNLVQNQMNRERANNAAYAAFAAALEDENWPGFAAWMAKAAADEWSHYLKFRDYLIDRLQKPVLAALEAPPNMDASNPVPLFRAALELERENTKSIVALNAMSEAGEDDIEDALFETWLIWGLDEQRNSERELTDAVLELSRVENDPAGLLALDREYQEKG